MTLLRTKSGRYEADYRYAGHERLHLSLGVRWCARDGKPLPKREAGENAAIAQARHDAVEKLFRQNRRDMLAQLRLPKHHPQRLTVERLAQMVEHHEPLVPIAGSVAAPEIEPASDRWGTLREVGERYLEWLRTHRRKSKGTHETAGAQLRRFLAFEYEGMPLGDRPFDAITTPMIEAYQTGMIDGGAKPNTITAYMIRVGALWRWASERENREARQQKRPAMPIYSPVIADELYRKATARDRYLDGKEVERLLAATPEPLMAIVCLALFAGLRLEEALYLRRKDVDLELGLLSITEKTLPDGAEWTPKTRRSRRDIPIGPSLRPVLEQHLVGPHAGEEWVTARAHDAAWPWHPRVFQVHMTGIVQRAQLIPGRTDPLGVTYHTLRHTFASHLAMRGVDLFTIAQLLGDTMATVEATYAHLSPDFKRAAVAKLAQAFSVPETDTKES